MMFVSHFLFGILSGYFACNFLNCDNTFLFVSIAAVASSFPDIDHVSSKISRKLPPFAIVSHSLFAHRGFIHSLFPPLLLYFMIFKIDSAIAAAVLVGYISHLLLDATTTRGIRFFYPLPFKIKGFIRTNSFAEKIVTMLLLIVIITIVVMTLFIK
ncbi:hypothetical protein CMO88_00825 [Candidatus Woesearchaeota archaeon]|nr:hypothetical protein [Candidatus Woesearchaeota archaeon]|tara:strand:+ start:825 stop:1292 length:468 start_codon:yes stop_codon:yes gene_type:complete